MTKKVDWSALLNLRQLKQTDDELEKSACEFESLKRLKLIGGDRWQEECERNMASDSILSQLTFVESDSAVYEYQSDPMPSFSFKKQMTRKID